MCGNASPLRPLPHHGSLIAPSRHRYATAFVACHRPHRNRHQHCPRGTTACTTNKTRATAIKSGRRDASPARGCRGYGKPLQRKQSHQHRRAWEAIPKSQHPYQYGYANPISNTDPSGMCPFCVAVIGGAALNAGIEYGMQVWDNHQQGLTGWDAWTNVCAPDIMDAALAGGVAGGTSFVLGPLAGAFTRTGLRGAIGFGMIDGALSGGASQVALNLVRGRAWDHDLGRAVVGGVLGGAVGGAIGLGAFDKLATKWMVRSDINITKRLAAMAPVDELGLASALSVRDYRGKAADWWLNKRGKQILYRGQGGAHADILSPLARDEGLGASKALLRRMRTSGMSDEKIASYTALYHEEQIPPYDLPPGFGSSDRLGAIGIPSTSLPGIGGPFAGTSGSILILRVPHGMATRPARTWYPLEEEWVFFNRIPRKTIVGTLSPMDMPWLTAQEDDLGRLTVTENPVYAR
jgi:hypothetical protein